MVFAKNVPVQAVEGYSGRRLLLLPNLTARSEYRKLRKLF
jgi:hypothetical protein